MVDKFEEGHKVKYINPLFDIFTNRSRIGKVVEVLKGDQYVVEFEGGLKLTVDASELQMVESYRWSWKTNCTCESRDLFQYGCRCGHFGLKKEECVGAELSEQARKEFNEYENKLEASRKKQESTDDKSDDTYPTGIWNSTD